MSFSVIIPARMTSTRLPGKPLLDIAGKPLIQHVYQRAVESGAEQIIVATDSQDIAHCVGAFGGQIQLTRSDHESGTDRIVEVVDERAMADEEIVVNLQGDEPLMPGSLLQQVANDLIANGDVAMATLATPINRAEELFDPSVVKVSLDARGCAMTFSRAPIPWHRQHFQAHPRTLPPSVRYLRHLGLYAYRVGFLRKFKAWARCEPERMEALEQLRVLYNGSSISVTITPSLPHTGVDTQADLERVRRIFEQLRSRG